MRLFIIGAFTVVGCKQYAPEGVELDDTGAEIEETGPEVTTPIDEGDAALELAISQGLVVSGHTVYVADRLFPFPSDAPDNSSVVGPRFGGWCDSTHNWEAAPGGEGQLAAFNSVQLSLGFEEESYGFVTLSGRVVGSDCQDSEEPGDYLDLGALVGQNDYVCARPDGIPVIFGQLVDGKFTTSPCSNMAQDLLELTWYRDYDEDGFGDPDTSVRAVEQPDGFVADNTDCWDTEEEVNPEAEEVENDLDDDCDGQTDNLPENTDTAEDEPDEDGRSAVTIKVTVDPTVTVDWQIWLNVIEDSSDTSWYGQTGAVMVPAGTLTGEIAVDLKEGDTWELNGSCGPDCWLVLQNGDRYAKIEEGGVEQTVSHTATTPTATTCVNSQNMATQPPHGKPLLVCKR